MNVKIGTEVKQFLFWEYLFRIFDIVEVPNRNSISCSNISLQECSPVMQAARVRFPAETRLSRGALVEDGDDLGQVSSMLCLCSVEELCIKKSFLTKHTMFQALILQ
jgi:hypothetical protein